MPPSGCLHSGAAAPDTPLSWNGLYFSLSQNAPFSAFCAPSPPFYFTRSRRSVSHPRRSPSLVPGDMRAGNGFLCQCAHWYKKRFLQSASRPKRLRFRRAQIPHALKDAKRISAPSSASRPNALAFQASAEPRLRRRKAAKRIFFARSQAQTTNRILSQ